MKDKIKVLNNVEKIQLKIEVVRSTYHHCVLVYRRKKNYFCHWRICNRNSAKVSGFCGNVS
jgi:hypothetical protein